MSEPQLYVFYCDHCRKEYVVSESTTGSDGRPLVRKATASPTGFVVRCPGVGCGCVTTAEKKEG